MEVRDLGLIDYSEALALQRQLVETKTETVLICEHPAVITVGRARGAASDVLTQNFPVTEVERGGRATLHLPGQVVVYPIINLKKLGLDQVKFLRLLESVIIKTLADFEIPAHTIEKETGVWVDESKIASLGIAVRNDMSMHGLALNVSCDLSLYKNLRPCGFSPDVMTSLKVKKGSLKLSDAELMNQVRRRIADHLVEDIKNVNG